MNRRDEILQSLTPLVPVPRFEALSSDPRADGHRFLVAEDGLWVEVDLPWLCARAQIAPSAIALPFGRIAPQLYLKCGPLPKADLMRFTALAREACPNEIAAIITWHRASGAFALKPVTLESGSAHVDWERTPLAEGEYLVADLHSHGRHPARFSAQDDRDDFGEIKFSVVVGRCDTEAPEVAARFCLLGLYLPTGPHPGLPPAGSEAILDEGFDEASHPA